MRAGLTIPHVPKAEIMDKLQVVQFDVRGTRVENRVLREKIPLKYKDCPWIVPNGSPYFAESALVDLFNEAGGRLTLGTDYWFEGEFEPFCEATGRSICSFVKLSDKALAENEFVSMTYQSIGAWFVPRNSIDEWVREIYIGKIPIPWSKVFNVPPTLPSSKHSHSIKTEIGDWYELTFFFMYLANYYSTRDPAVYDEADRVISESFAKLKEVKRTQLARLNNHDKDYGDPHQITKFHLQLGNHDNFDTATPEQDLAGTAANLLSTPEGVMRLADKYTAENSNLMRNGVLPVSYFGNGGYIPPTIVGSFEGLGSRSECMGICVEASGRTVLIQNHFDGRTEGLYFSLLSDIKNPDDPKNPYRFEYTAYRYEPPVLTNNNAKPTNIIAGSGNDIIMVGQVDPKNYASDRWFIALTSNTFDPSSHRYIETNMANVFAECGVPNANGFWGSGKPYHWQLTIDLLGEWVLLTVDAAPANPGINGQQGRMVRFRIPKKSLLDGTPATWQLLKVTYQDYDGVQYTNVNGWNYATKVISGGLVSKWGRYTFNQQNPPQSVGTFNYRAVNLYAKKTGVPNVYYASWLGYTLLSWVVPGRGFNSSRTASHMVYELNIETGVMTLVYKQLPLNVDFVNDTGGSVATADLNKFAIWYGSMVRYHSAATVVTPNGEKIMSCSAPNQELSPLNAMIEYHKFALNSGGVINTDEQLLSGDLSYDRLKGNGWNVRSRSIQTPIPIGVANRWVAYEGDGENFMTQTTVVTNPAAGLPYPEVVYREVSGGYTVRPEVTNKELAPMYSRPLVNKVYKTNMSNLEGVVSGTGTSAELNGRGIDCGTMSLSACGFSSAAYPSYAPLTTFPSAAFRALNEQGAFLSFPKTFTKKLDVVNQRMMYTPSDYYGLAPAIKDKIRALIPVAQQGPYWAFSLFVLNGESGGMFGGMNKALLYVKFPTSTAAGNDSYDAMMLLVNLVVEAPTAAHPGCHLVTDYQIVGRSVTYMQHYALSPGLMGGQVHFSNRPYLTFYRDGNVLKCFLTSGMTVFGGTFDCTVFNMDIVTGAFSQLAADHAGANVGDPVCAVPRVGLTKFTVAQPDTYSAALRGWTSTGLSNDPSGGAARTMPVLRQDGGTDYYAMITSYPETGWAVFFLEDVAVMVQGTMYRATTGTVDLRDIDPDPRNKVFYVYITIEDTVARYIFSTVKLRKGNAVMLVAIITTNEKQILTLERRTPCVVGDYELSFIRDGGIIPISAGFPQDDGIFKFVKTSELLP